MATNKELTTYLAEIDIFCKIMNKACENQKQKNFSVRSENSHVVKVPDYSRQRGRVVKVPD